MKNKLDILARLLMKHALTAAQISKRLRVSKPTVYRRIERLEECAVKVQRRLLDTRKRGPIPVAFYI